MKASEPAMVYQIKVTLDSIRPPVWRRVLVRDKMTLLDLHAVIQDVFGWLDYHLHEFKIHDVSYGDPANDEFREFGIQDEANFKLQKLNLSEGTHFAYEYDFGDSWHHTLLVEKILPFEKGMRLPQCITGERACPPEDVGGPWGYEGFLEAIRDPQNEEHDSYLEWSGGEFDPEEFDLAAANQRLLQQPEQNWAGSGSANLLDGGEEQKSLFDPVRWANLLTNEGEATAKMLALRLDVVTFLTYLKENKVTGTQSTGNLPRKVIDEICPRFVNPPELETHIGDTVFRFLNEREVWPIYYVHVLAQGAGLISGGPGRRWRLTGAGEEFLTLPAVAQVGILFVAWWYRVNWLVAYSYNFFDDGFQVMFAKTVRSYLNALPIDEPHLFVSAADQLIQAAGWAWRLKENDTDRTILRAAIQEMVIGPMESFGVLSIERKKEDGYSLEIQQKFSFSMTGFGRALLQSV